MFLFDIEYCPMNLPIVCTLNESELRERRKALMDTFRSMAITASELPDGYVFNFPVSSEALHRITDVVDLERQCCAFLTFKIVVEAANAAMRLEVTGPGEAKNVIAEFMKK